MEEYNRHVMKQADTRSNQAGFCPTEVTLCMVCGERFIGGKGNHGTYNDGEDCPLKVRK